jgi:hypothetical protein
MNPQLLPATARDDVSAWQQTVVAFLAEKERRSGSRRTVEGYARMLWPFFDRVGTPDKVTPAHVLAWAHGIGASGREPSSATVGARIACLSSYFRFLIRMNVAVADGAHELLDEVRGRLDAGLTDEQRQEIVRLLVKITVRTDASEKGGKKSARAVVEYAFPKTTLGVLQTSTGTRSTSSSRRPSSLSDRSSN